MSEPSIPDRKKIRTTNTTMHKGDWSKPKDCRLSNVDNRERHLFNADGSPADHSKPSIANRTGLNFSQALELMKEGKTVRRKDCPERKIIDGKMMDRCGKHWDELIAMNTSNIMADDWEVVDDV